MGSWNLVATQVAPASTAYLVVPCNDQASSHLASFFFFEFAWSQVYHSIKNIKQLSSRRHVKSILSDVIISFNSRHHFPSSNSWKEGPHLRYIYLVIVSPKRRTDTRGIRRTPKGPPSSRKLRQAQILIFKSHKKVLDGSPAGLIAPPTSTIPPVTTYGATLRYNYVCTLS